MEIADRSKDGTKRFVLLHHVMPAHALLKTHWDLMLEEPDGLLTFRLDQLPQERLENATDPRQEHLLVLRLPDHRPIYLRYEGELSGDRGRVTQVAAGSLHPQYASGCTRCRLHSDSLSAELEFVGCPPGQDTWLRILKWQWGRPQYLFRRIAPRKSLPET